MLFSKMKIYQFKDGFNVTEDKLNKALATGAFKSLDRTQITSSGFVDPLSKGVDTFVHGVADAFMVTLRQDSKSIPAAAVNKKTKQRIKDLEARKLDKATKDEKQEIKEAVLAELVASFPVDFIKTTYFSALIMPADGILVVDTTSTNSCELVLTQLRRAIGSLPIIDFETESLPSVVMTDWVKTSDLPEGIVLSGSCSLVDETTDSGSQAVLKNYKLDSDEILGLVDAGMVVSSISLVWNDSLNMKIDADLAITGVSCTDVLKEHNKESQKDSDFASRFDSELYMVTENMKILIPNLRDIFK